MKIKQLLWVVFAALTFTAATCGGGSNDSDLATVEINNFLSISDIHFNPYYDTSLINDLIKSSADQWEKVFQSSSVKSYGYYGWNGQFYDTGYPLFKSALDAMKAANPNPEFITVNGDFLAHSFESEFQTLAKTTNLDSLQNFTVKTVQYIVSSIEKTFPGVPIFPTLGNNDSFCGDYEIQTPGSFLTRTAPIFEKSLNNLVNSSDFNASYKKGGYFVAKSPVNPKHKIISLNTVMLSTKYMENQNFCGQTPDSVKNRASAEAQFTWLENELKMAQSNGDKVWLMYHIPPGFNGYSSASNADTSNCMAFEPAPYYHLDYNQQYLSIVNKYQSVIAAQLGGHTHMDNFIVINGDQTPNSFVHISPAISPVYYNNPGFLEYTFLDDGSILKDYEVYGFNNVETATSPNWKPEYKFSTAYNKNELTPQSLKAVYKSFETDTIAAERYIEYYVVEDSANVSMDKSNWYYYYCAFGNQTVQEYKDCVCNEGK